MFKWLLLAGNILLLGCGPSTESPTPSPQAPVITSHVGEDGLERIGINFD